MFFFSHTQKTEKNRAEKERRTMGKMEKLHFSVKYQNDDLVLWINFNNEFIVFLINTVDPALVSFLQLFF